MLLATGIVFYILPVWSQQDETLDPAVVEELKPNLELGPRLISDLSEKAQKVARDRLLKSTNRVMPEIPKDAKDAMFTAMMASSPMSVRDMFNFWTDKKKVTEGLSFDEVIEAMDLKANEVNFKKTGHSEIWRDVGAITGEPTLRIEVLQYCDAPVGRKMMDYSPEFSIFIPCRITVYEDANGDLWVMTLDWDVGWLAMTWHPDSQLDPELKEDAKRIRDAMETIMHAGATGEW